MAVRFSLLMLLWVVSCGGRSAQNDSGTAASAGADASGGTDATGGAYATGGASSTSTTCPIARPVAGTHCNYTGNQCNYSIDRCSSVGFLCSGGAWVAQQQNDGSALTCFNFRDEELGIPKDGDSCACRGMLDCTFDECATQGRVHAVCDNAIWHVTSAACAGASCGSETCKIGEVCMVSGAMSPERHECAPDPCEEQSQTTACACAGSLCRSPDTRCVVNSGVLECICDTC